MSKSEDDLIMSGLTDEERAALAEPDDEDPNATQEELEAKAAAAGGATTTTEDDDDNKDAPAPVQAAAAPVPAAAADVPAAAAASAAPAATAEATADEPGTAPGAPIFVAEAPADAEAKLAEIAAKKADLRKKYDDGDITFEEYDSQKDVLSKDERTIERQVDTAKIAADMEQQRQKNDWFATCAAFVDANGYKDNARLQRALDQEVRDVASSAEFKGRTDPAAGKAILAKAHANLIEAGMVKAATAAPATPVPPKNVTPKPALPPSLGGLPAATANDPGEGRFASLDRLQTSNPAGYEAALAKLSEAELDAYLASA